MRAVVDVNVLISGVLAPTGASAEMMQRWLRGDFELVVSDALLDELSRALAYPKVRRRVSDTEAQAVVALLRRSATVAAPTDAPLTRRSRDPGDDYLLALASATDSVLVTWDRDLLDIADAPIEAPPAFLLRLEKT